VIFGTRPEIIKLSGLRSLLGERAWTLHTGQHYDPALSSTVLDELGFGPPDVRLDVGGLTRAEQIGEGTVALSAALAAERPDVVVVQGDTNSTLAGGLAANVVGIPLVHIEAGLRSFDRRMPEEHNRRLVDHLADLCLAPTPIAVANLAAEGIGGQRVELTGNTIVEATRGLVPDPAERANVRAAFGLAAEGYVLATFHRPENVDGALLEVLLEELGLIARDRPVILPLHPRTRARVTERGVHRLLEPLIVTDPLPYHTFLALAADAALLVSDSGGLQEEASVLRRPIVVVRRSTERPEVLGGVGSLVAPAPDVVSKAALDVLSDLPATLGRIADLPCPYGDGTASRRAVAAINRLLTRG
jgi:UDP-N-acetylglucosamine 2-epimerase (non-hydrolysing)